MTVNHLKTWDRTSHMMANDTVWILLISNRGYTLTQCVTHSAVAYSCNNSFIFLSCLFLGPAAFNVTAKAVFLSSMWEQIKVTWTVSCTAKGLSVNRKFWNTSVFIPLNSTLFYDTHYDTVHVLVPLLGV